MAYKYHYIVYIHINKTNGKVYVGITCRPVEARWLNGRGYKSNKHFYRAIQKYGWVGFIHMVFRSQLSKEEAAFMEQQLITAYRADDPLHGYNKTKGGEGNYQGKNSGTEEYRKDYNTTYYEDHKEKFAARNKDYYEVNREESITRAKDYYEAHKEERKAYNKTHREEIKVYQREYNQKYYEAHKEEIKTKQREYNQKYRQEHKNKTT